MRMLVTSHRGVFVMVITRWLASVLAVLSCLAPAVVRAADTGSISGVVFDQGGQLVEGATVRLTGDPLPGERVATTDARGAYRFPLLLPGAYLLDITKQGVGTSKRAVTVQVDVDAQTDVVLGLNLNETIAVTAAAPRVDLRSTEVNFNFSKELIDQLPLQRTYAGLFQLVPGVAENNSFAPNGGGSRQDNTYLLDGVNITNPGFGYLSTEVNEFDIQEFSVKRGAITAEFGRASGFVTNAVTRSGSNALSGGARFEVIPSAWIADSDKRIRSTTEPAGAVVRARRADPARQGVLLRLGPAHHIRHDRSLEQPGRRCPIGSSGPTTISARSRRRRPTSTSSAPATARGPNTDDFAGVGANDSAGVATDTEGTNRVATATYSWFFSSTGYLDVKYLRLDEQNETVARHRPRVPAGVRRQQPAAIGHFTDPATGVNVGGAALKLNRQNYTRDEVKRDVSQYLDLGHVAPIKAGFGVEGTTQEDLTRDVERLGRDLDRPGRHAAPGALLPAPAVAAVEVADLQPLLPGQHARSARAWWSTPACCSTRTTSPRS